MFFFINTNKFKTLDKTPTVSYVAKTQRTLKKIKLQFTLQVYNKVYSTGSNVSKFYGTAKVQKLSELGTVDQLLVSNIGTASYYLTKRLAKILALLTKILKTVQNTKDFVNSLKPKQIPSSHQLNSFDVVSMFTNVPIDATIDIIVRSIY